MKLMLFIHVVIATISFAAAIISLVNVNSMWRRSGWASAIVTMVTGVALLVMSPGTSLARLCGLSGALVALLVVSELRGWVANRAARRS